MKLSRYEEESILNYNVGEQTATFYTRDKAVMRKVDTLVAEFPDTYKLMKQDEVSKSYSFPKSYVSYCKPRAVSTEQRERARQMMIKKIRQSKFNQTQWKYICICGRIVPLSNSINRKI